MAISPCDIDTLEDDTVTLRHRDSMEQERVAIADIERERLDQVRQTNPALQLRRYQVTPREA